ncbi:UNVERIFIED_CONTAM: hypothetical protein Cloal_3391 [Acetivibrio alkalicellulosi]
MNNKLKYYRTFLILNREDSSLNEGKDSLGYLKIEVIEEKAKVNCQVSNLNEDNRGYKLYIMKVEDESIIPYCLGEVCVCGNSGQLSRIVDANNVGGTGVSIDKFNVAAVIINSLHEKTNNIACLAAAYKNQKIQWKNKFKTYISSQGDNKEEKPREKEEKLKCDKTNSENRKDTVTEIQKTINLQTENNDINYENDRIDLDHNNQYKKNDKTIDNVDNKVSLDKVLKGFDSYFERVSPFNIERKDYKWWRVISPVHLNNIFYQLNIKIPVLFNPMVMMAHFKYRHIITGIYEREKDNVFYLVCGIPSLYKIDEKPFGNMCRWAQIEGKNPRYGSFGYWLIYINPKNGNILNDD